jgi:hypothetical protein
MVERNDSEKVTERQMDLHNESMVVLRRFWQEGEAQIVYTYLDTNGIDCRLSFKHAMPGLFPMTVNGLGEIQLLVAEDQVDHAERLLADPPPAPEWSDQESNEG